MGKNERIQIRINDALVLAYIFNEYEEFVNDYKQLKKDVNDYNILFKILNNKELNDLEIGFYNKYKEVIDTINKYTSIVAFLDNPFVQKGIVYLYNYIFKNQNKLLEITKILEKIKELGFEYFVLDEEYNFTSDIYQIPFDFIDCHMVTYFDNIKAIPSAVWETVTYKSTDSNYLICVGNPSSKLLGYEKGILLNDLTFDVNRLPKTIIFDELYTRILVCQNNVFNECREINNTINLEVSLDELALNSCKNEEIVNSLEDSRDKDELMKQLQTIKYALLRMKLISDKYHKSIIERELITEENLIEAKKKRK